MVQGSHRKKRVIIGVAEVMHCGTKVDLFEISYHILSHELGNEQTNERSRAHERSEQCGAST